MCALIPRTEARAKQRLLKFREIQKWLIMKFEKLKKNLYMDLAKEEEENDDDNDVQSVDLQ